MVPRVVPSTHGIPNSWAMIAPWLIDPPTSRTAPAATMNNGVQPEFRELAHEDFTGFDSLRRAAHDVGDTLDHTCAHALTAQHVGRFGPDGVRRHIASRAGYRHTSEFAGDVHREGLATTFLPPGNHVGELRRRRRRCRVGDVVDGEEEHVVGTLDRAERGELAPVVRGGGPGRVEDLHEDRLPDLTQRYVSAPDADDRVRSRLGRSRQPGPDRAGGGEPFVATVCFRDDGLRDGSTRRSASTSSRTGFSSSRHEGTESSDSTGPWNP